MSVELKAGERVTIGEPRSYEQLWRQNESLSAGRKAAQAEIDQLRKENAKLRGEFDVLGLRYMHAEGQIAKLRESISVMEETLLSGEAVMRNGSRRIAELTHRLNDADCANDHLSKQLADMSSRLRMAERRQ